MRPVVVKIGGSTLGNHDTTIEDLVTLQRVGIPVVVVHGGGREINSWLSRLNISSKFVQGLRVTDLETLKVVTAVLSGLINKELVSVIWRLGGMAVGISGADGNLIKAKNKTPELGYTGEELEVNASILQTLLAERYIPVVAPICIGLFDNRGETNLINVNADTVAAEVAAALDAEKLIFLTDVPGLYDGSKNIISKLSHEEARVCLESGLASGGMATKIKACLTALTKVSVTRIIDGRVLHALRDEIEGKGDGTTITQ